MQNIIRGGGGVVGGGGMCLYKAN